MSALRRHVLANSFKTSNAVVVAWPHLLVALASRNHPIALLMPQRGRRPRHQKQTWRPQILTYRTNLLIVVPVVLSATYLALWVAHQTVLK